MKGAWRIHSIAVGLGCVVGCGDPGGMSGPDAGVQPRCNPAANFGRQTDLQGLNTTANEEQATLSPDELTIYFSRDDGNGAYDIYQATRTSKTTSFSGAIPVPGVNTMAEDREPRVTADGLAMFATTRDSPSGLFRVAFATRTSKDAAFGSLQPVPGVNGTTNDSDPFISADGRVLYLSSDRGGNYALYRSTQTGGGFSPPEPVAGAKLETAYMELTPVLSEDELTMYFASSRPNLGSLDIYQATRASVQDPFGEPVALTELNGPEAQVPSWISADNCELYFTRYVPVLGLELTSALRGR
jgi:Tol biopolymer transport system component